jgi:hypothetical protein
LTADVPPPAQIPTKAPCGWSEGTATAVPWDSTGEVYSSLRQSSAGPATLSLPHDSYGGTGELHRTRGIEAMEEGRSWARPAFIPNGGRHRAQHSVPRAQARTRRGFRFLLSRADQRGICLVFYRTREPTPRRAEVAADRTGPLGSGLRESSSGWPLGPTTQ